MKKLFILLFAALTVSVNAQQQGPIVPSLQTITNVIEGFYIKTTNGLAVESLSITNNGGSATLNFNGNSPALPIHTLSFKTNGVAYGEIVSTPNIGFRFWDNNQQALLSITTAGVITGTSAVGNDIRGHERFQFDNRADVTVSAGTDTTLISGTFSGTTTVAADYLTQGSIITVEMGGTTTAGAGGTFTNKVFLDSTNLCTSIVTVADSSQWYFKSSTTIRTTGSGGTYKTRGFYIDSQPVTTTHPSGSGNINTVASHVLNVTSANDTGGGADQIVDFLRITIVRP